MLSIMKSPESGLSNILNPMLTKNSPLQLQVIILSLNNDFKIIKIINQLLDLIKKYFLKNNSR